MPLMLQSDCSIIGLQIARHVTHDPRWICFFNSEITCLRCYIVLTSDVKFLIQITAISQAKWKWYFYISTHIVAARLGWSRFCCSSVIATIVDIITPINEIWISTPCKSMEANFVSHQKQIFILFCDVLKFSSKTLHVLLAQRTMTRSMPEFRGQLEDNGLPP